MFVVGSWSIAVNLDGISSNSVLSFLTCFPLLSLKGQTFVGRNFSSLCLVA